MSTSTYGQENNSYHHCITDKDWYITYLLTYFFIHFIILFYVIYVQIKM